jgi:hypothetical protein
LLLSTHYWEFYLWPFTCFLFSCKKILSLSHFLGLFCLELRWWTEKAERIQGMKLIWPFTLARWQELFVERREHYKRKGRVRKGICKKRNSSKEMRARERKDSGSWYVW